ncbi:uncharacterized protein LOC108109928 [Drosophila eugracilis]|uniref:uncharacterized protein LOC108109928 n=1 Tax=Drosophila eugracilis TaxID=29029 RepID=UPI0007E7A45F|nr:uncharacterized protein LOC108109928 [Drosophila eugracilis]
MNCQNAKLPGTVTAQICRIQNPKSGEPLLRTSPSQNQTIWPKTFVLLEISSPHKQTKIPEPLTIGQTKQVKMQNSAVISRMNAGLSRCLSHHRKLCRGIAELDCLIYNDEFLKDPRTQWLLHQRRQRAEEKAKEEAKVSSLGRMGSEMGRLLGQSPVGKSNLTVNRAFCQLLQSTPSGLHPTKLRNLTGPLPARTPEPSPERRPSFKFSVSPPSPDRKSTSRSSF